MPLHEFPPTSSNNGVLSFLQPSRSHPLHNVLLSVPDVRFFTPPLPSFSLQRPQPPSLPPQQLLDDPPLDPPYPAIQTTLTCGSSDESTYPHLNCHHWCSTPILY
eukprot:747935-Hanusia_phi.AAC.5